MVGPPAWQLGEELTSSHREKLTHYKMLQKVLDMDGFFGSTKAVEREHEKWNLAVKGLYGSESLNIFTK